MVNKKSALGTDEILKINLERLSLSLIWVQILHRALLIQSDCALILCRLIDRQGRKRFVVISVSYLWCLHVGFAFFIEGKLAEEGSLEEGKEWIYCIDRRIAFFCVY